MGFGAQQDPGDLSKILDPAGHTGTSCDRSDEWK